MESLQKPVHYFLKEKLIQSRTTYIIMIFGNILTNKAKKSGGTKNKMYCKRSQKNGYTIFQVTSTVVRVHLLSFYRYLEANGH